ncbi:MAG TPA: Holliday junction resolvase RuvX [Candidatus Saccharimonadia bacterium]
MTDSILAIDYGKKRVGLALAVQGVPQRLQTLPNDELLVGRLADIVQNHQIGLVVLGLPRTSNGDDTAWTAEVRQFAKNLGGEISAPVTLRDEFATTDEARARLVSQKLEPGSQKALLDQEAAVVLLEDYLNAL